MAVNTCNKEEVPQHILFDLELLHEQFWFDMDDSFCSKQTFFNVRKAPKVILSCFRQN